MRVMAAQPRTRRSDARDNRERILAVARAAFADGGDVPIREIARAANLGVATVYRHFPTKQDLLTAAFAEHRASCVGIVEEGLAHDDPWRGFGLVVAKLMAVRARDRGPAVAPERPLRLMRDLVQRAKDGGRLRADFVLEDLALALMTNEGIQAATPELTAAASRRFAAFLIQSFRTTPDPAALPPAVRLPLVAARDHQVTGTAIGLRTAKPVFQSSRSAASPRPGQRSSKVVSAT